MTGKVTLVGAGPGGRELLTLAGAAAIEKADAVVFDRLVNEDILGLIPETAERVNVGKENNHHPVPQDQINEILVRLAKQGKNVVRLKGGDCYLFGRGGEECEYLLENGVQGIHLYTMNNVEVATRISRNIENIIAAKNDILAG